MMDQTHLYMKVVGNGPTPARVEAATYTEQEMRELFMPYECAALADGQTLIKIDRTGTIRTVSATALALRALA